MKNFFANHVIRLILSIAAGLSMAFVLSRLPTSAQTSIASSSLQRETIGDYPVAPVSGTNTIYLPLVTRCWNDSTPLFGIQFYGDLTGPAGLNYASNGGARWIRVPIAWDFIEPANTTPDYYNWSRVDFSVANAINRRIELILTISSQPAWAAVYAMGPVTNTADIQEFVGALVERYDGDGIDDAPGSPVVRYFELYNEPDNTSRSLAESGGWGYWGHNGTGYANLLEALYPAVKAASPQAQLVFGGVALDYFEEAGGPFDINFIEDALSACQGKQCFDVMNFHYYPPFRVNWESYGADIIGKATYVRQKLAEYGFFQIPLLCTETSWVSGAEWGNDELQSRYVVKGYVRGMAADLVSLVWYRISDSEDVTLPGLLDSALLPKPAYSAYQVMTLMLEGMVYQRPLTPAETGSSQIAGYVFQRCGLRLDVVWTEDSTPYNSDDDPVLPLTVTASTLQVVDKFGNVQTRHDRDDGRVDGLITIEVTGSPLYLEYNP